jgi:hypothetical protein
MEVVPAASSLCLSGNLVSFVMCLVRGSYTVLCAMILLQVRLLHV